jgi:endonuclease/exonuclease/phosphatase family metal-dependent hydrolase
MRLVVILAALLPAASPRAIGQTGTFVDRQDPADLRLVTYNVNWDSIFPDNDPNNHSWRAHDMVDEFRRVVTALNPDIMCLQEINPSRDAQDVADILDAVIPLGGGARWQAAIGSSNVIVARYPLSLLSDVTVPPGQRAQSMALVDLPNGTYDRDIYIINEHYKCCGGSGNEAKRQQQSDAIVNWMRDARTPGESIDLPAGTLMVALGDLNIVEGPGPLNTLLTGDIFDEGTYGNDSPPDWDGSDAADGHPWHNGVGPDDYTWRNDNGSYAPGRLDYVVFTDSAATLAHRFVLNTTTMTQGDLNATGLQAFDVVPDPPGYFDHLPVVVDLRLPPPVPLDGDVSLDGLTNGDDINWFVDLAQAGAAGDPVRIAHADYNADGVIDSVDIPGFLGDLLAP